MWHRWDHRATGQPQPRRAGADERRYGPPRPGRQRDMGLRSGLARVGRASRPPSAFYPRSLARRRSAHGGPGDRPRRRLQRRDLQFSGTSAAPGGRGSETPVHRRHRRHAPRPRPARAGRGKLAPRHVRLRLLGPDGAPTPAGQGSPGHQASVPGALVGSGSGLVARLRFRASRLAGLRTAGLGSNSTRRL